MRNNKVIVIVGPTAVGKTRVGIELAKKLDGEIVSADSMQIYRHMNIGTAKPTPDEMQGIPHYMIDIAEPDEEFSVARYKEMALECIKDIAERGKLPIIVGGTGLYVNSVVDNIEFSEIITDRQYREQLEKRAETEGTAVLHEELKDIDSEAAERIHPHDLRRIVRALEVYKFTGKPISYHQMVSKQKPSDYDFIMTGLTMERESLYSRINERVDNMISEGLEEEVKDLVKNGVGPKSTAMQGLGYKEMVDYLENKVSYDEVIEIIKRDSRRYAKRQLTWFRRDKRIFWVDMKDGLEKVSKKIFIYLEANELFR